MKSRLMKKFGFLWGSSRKEIVRLLDENDKDYIIRQWGSEELPFRDFYISRAVFVELLLLSNEGVIVVASTTADDGKGGIEPGRLVWGGRFGGEKNCSDM